MKIYISGPMTGFENFNRDAFFRAEAMLRKYAPGADIFNPASLHIQDGKWSDYMREDLAQLVTCDAIACLGGWQNSRGALLENKIADELNLIRFLIDVERETIDYEKKAVA